MFYIAPSCPICSTGVIGFCRCDDNVHLALMCKDCHSLWLDPNQVDATHARFPPHTAQFTHGHCHWASEMEIQVRGWFEWISGELAML